MRKLSPIFWNEKGDFSASRFFLWNDRLSGAGAFIPQANASGYGAGRRRQFGRAESVMSVDFTLAFMEGRATRQRRNHLIRVPTGAAFQPAAPDMGLPADATECAGAGVPAVFGGMVGFECGGAGDNAVGSPGILRAYGLTSVSFFDR